MMANVPPLRFRRSPGRSNLRPRLGPRGIRRLLQKAREVPFSHAARRGRLVPPPDDDHDCGWKVYAKAQDAKRAEAKQLRDAKLETENVTVPVPPDQGTCPDCGNPLRAVGAGNHRRSLPTSSRTFASVFIGAKRGRALRPYRDRTRPEPRRRKDALPAELRRAFDRQQMRCVRRHRRPYRAAPREVATALRTIASLGPSSSE